MADIFKVSCFGCPCVCPALPLTREMFAEIYQENTQLALNLALLDCILVDCYLAECYLYFKLPQGELVF